MDQSTIHKLALKAGAAKFYPEAQTVKEDNFLVSSGFLERFAAEIEHHVTVTNSLNPEGT